MLGPLLGPLAANFSICPACPTEHTLPSRKGKRVTVPIQNDDLPTLRADWLREIVRPVLGDALSGDIDILENPPQQEHERTAELVLFVEW